MRKTYLFTLLSAVLLGVKVSAQSSLLGTLNHDGTVTTFYGATALQEAHAAAAHGDVITLSSGTFAGVDITKAVTIRGAGMEVDTVSHTEPTIISNDFSINITDSVSDRLTFEGVYSNQTITVYSLSNAMLLKSRFKRFSCYDYNNSVMNNLSVIHCRISESFECTNNGSCSFINSIIYPYNRGYLSFNNCLLLGNSGITKSEYKNCVIVDANGSTTATSSYYNNLFISDNSKILNSTTNTTNVRIATSDSKVSNLVGDYNDSKTYELSDEAKALVTGTDGKEVGIYGGSLPYDPTPTNPQITKFEVAAKSTADGKLSVDIEVNSAE